MDLARVLVIANRTAGSPELRAALLQRRERGPIAVTLLVPAGWEIQEPGGDVASGRRRLEAAVRALEDQGIEVEAKLGDPDPIAALRDAWRPGRYDEVIVSTLPNGRSRWMALDVPRLAGGITGIPVTHVEGDGAGSPA